MAAWHVLEDSLRLPRAAEIDVGSLYPWPSGHGAGPAAVTV